MSVVSEEYEELKKKLKLLKKQMKTKAPVLDSKEPSKRAKREQEKAKDERVPKYVLKEVYNKVNLRALFQLKSSQVDIEWSPYLDALHNHIFAPKKAQLGSYCVP